jgi:iron complex outermembrane recepter protein
MRKILVALLCTSAAPTLAFAQTVQDTAVENQTSEQAVKSGSAALEADTLGEILVTSQRRVQIAREVPLALSAVDPVTIKKLKISDVSGLGTTVPGITTVYQGLDQPVIVVRGVTSNSIGIGGESSVGFFVDDAYVGRLQALSVPFLDIERIEVLRGPQGSLYGRNSTGGAISVVTNKPRLGQTSAELTASYGSFRSYDATATFNLPVSDVLAARVALLTRGDGGYDRNITTGTRVQSIRVYSGRLSFSYEPTSDVSAILGLSYARERTGGLAVKTADPGLAALGGVDANPFSGRVAQNFDGFSRRNAYGANLSVTAQISENTSLKSVTSYNRANIAGLFDVDGSVAPVQEFRVSDQRIESLGQEARFNFENGPVRFVVCGNAFFEWVGDTRSLTYDENFLLPLITANVFGSADGTVPADVLGAGSPAFIPCDPNSNVLLGVGCSARQSETIFQSGRYLSLAAFVDAELKVTDTLTLIAGGRYSSDMKRFIFNTPLIVSQGSILVGTNPLLTGSTTAQGPLSKTWSDFQPRAVVRWQPSPLLNIYGSVTRGFKSGGFDPATRNGVYDPDLTQFEPESVWSYELGLKAALFDRVAELNLAGYRYIYEGLQAQVIRNGVTSTLNGPSYNSWGAEGDVTIRPNRMISLVVGGAYSGAAFGNFIVDDRFNPGQQQNLRGNRGIVSPEFSGFARADATIPINDSFELAIAADVNWRSKQFFSIYRDPRESQSAYALLGAQIAVKSASDHWSIAVNARNLLDKDYLTFSVNQGFGIGTLRGRPRSVSLDLRAKF